MAINSKTKEQLEKQLKLFFKHQKEIGKISEDKTKEILGVLSENDNITKRKEDIRDSLLGVLSKEEIDQLYGEYKEYYKSQIKKFRDTLKKYKLFPDKYEFLLNDFIYQILKDNDYDLEGLNKEIEETSEDDVHQFRERVKANIVALETLFPDRKVLLKFKGEIFLSDNTDDLISIITALKEVGIKKIYNITYLVDLIQYGYPEKIKENILTLEEIGINVNANFDKLYNIILKGEKENILTIGLLGINKADDIIKFDKLIRYGDTKRIKLIIGALKEVGIKGVDNFVRLEDLVRHGDVEKIQSNILTLRILGIKGSDNISKFKNIIMGGEPEKIKSNVSMLKELGIKELDDIIKLENLVIYGESEKIKSNILALREIGIDGVDNFVKLDSLILYGEPEKIKSNISMLRELGIKELDDIIKLKDLVINGEPEKLRGNILALQRVGINEISYIIRLQNLILYGEPEKIEGNILALREMGIDGVDNFVKLDQIIRQGKPENIHLLKELGIKELDDIIKLKDLIIHGESEKMKSNILALREIGIKKIDDILRLYKIVGYGKPENIYILKELGIKELDDILKIEYEIINGEPEKLKGNILALQRAGIKELDDIIKLKDLVINGEPEKIEGNILALQRVGINEISYMIRLQNLIKHGEPEKIEGNILALREIGIDGVDNFIKLDQIIRQGKPENIRLLKELGINNISELLILNEIIKSGNSENIVILKDVGIHGMNNVLKLEDLIINGEPEKLRGNILALQRVGINEISYMIRLQNLIKHGEPEKIEGNILALREMGIDGVDEFVRLNTVILDGNPENIKRNILTLREMGIDDIDNILKFRGLNDGGKLEFEFKEENHKGYLKYIERVMNLSIYEYKKYALIQNILKLSFADIDNYLQKYIEFCIDKNRSYSQFLKFFDGKSFNENAMNFVSKGFELSRPEIKDDVGMLNRSINELYPQLDIRFNYEETKQILEFVNLVGGINKGYTILILTIEKMARDGIDNKNFNKILCEKLNNYKKIFDMYPEHRIPNGLKLSIGLEIEITKPYLNWFHETTGKTYTDFAKSIVQRAKVGIENEGIYEFATKPSTNPMVTLLEIHLLQELNLLDINDMQKLGGHTKTSYKSRNGTGYHINIGSDSDILIDNNIHFIQNLCTILPRSGISNGENNKKAYINPQGNIKSKSARFCPVYPDSTSKNYIELRTYSVDDVELFEKNVLFNSYAIMGSQAQKKVSDITGDMVTKLQNNDVINNTEDLMKYFEKNNLFKDNQDLKSKRIAAEFIFMQISVLRAINDYNEHFIDNELFGQEILQNLSEGWKDFLYNFLLSGQKETIGFEDRGWSSIIVKKYTNLNEKFNVTEYLGRSKPITSRETKKILDKNGNSDVDEKWIPYITNWINKKILWETLCIGCQDTQKLEDTINNKISNIDRIKGYIIGNDKGIKIDRQYLYNYFKSNMSLEGDKLYHPLNTEFANKIINLNNFFLKEDDTNANGVLQTTILNGDKEAEKDISKSSMFETGHMRKGYNYYQGGSENMLIHTVQRIALNYMENVKNILNSNTPIRVTS